MARGIQIGTVVLLFMPWILVGSGAYLYWRSERGREEEELAALAAEADGEGED